MRTSLKILMCGVACLALSAAALPLEAGIVPKGPAFVVSTETFPSAYRLGYLGSVPKAAMDARERFIVVWATAITDSPTGHVRARRYDRQGRGARPSNVTMPSPGTETQPDVAVDGSGSSVIVWTTASGEVWGRRLTRSGQLDVPDLRIDTSTSRYRWSPSVSASSSGAFVVVWTETSGGIEGDEVRARRFDETGSPIETEFLVSATGSHGAEAPDIATNGSGRFVVVYVKRLVAGMADVFASVFDDRGVLVIPEFQVNDEVTMAEQSDPGVAMDAAGNFIIVWDALSLEDFRRGIFAKRFDASGSPLASEFRVDEESSGYSIYPAVSMSTAGDFVVAWSGLVPSGSSSDSPAIRVRRFDTSGRPTGQTSTVASGEPHIRSIRPEVAIRPSGDFVILWSSLSSSFVRSRIRVKTTIHGREFNGRAPEVTEPANLETLDCSYPYNPPTFTWLGEGYDRFRVMLSWEESFREGARISSGEPLLTTTSWTPDPEAWASVCAVVLNPSRVAPSIHVRIVGVDTDSGSDDSDRILLGPTTSYYVRW